MPLSQHLLEEGEEAFFLFDSARRDFELSRRSERKKTRSFPPLFALYLTHRSTTTDESASSGRCSVCVGVWSVSARGCCVDAVVTLDKIGKSSELEFPKTVPFVSRSNTGLIDYTIRSGCC